MPRADRQSPLERIVHYFLTVPMEDAEAALSTATAIVKTRRGTGAVQLIAARVRTRPPKPAKAAGGELLP